MATQPGIRLSARGFGSLAAAVLFAVTAGACSSSKKTPAAAAGSGQPPACSKVTAASLNRALGVSVSEATGAAANPERCTYASTNGGSSVVVYYDVTDLQTFQAAVSSLNNTAPVSGLGSAAYTQTNVSNTDANLNAVDAYANGMETSVTADAALAKLEAFVRTLIS
jgi:hypothetical protein